MGLYTSVYKIRNCDRCGYPYECEYQFKTGDDYMGTYKDGDKANGVEEGEYGASRVIVCSSCYQILNHLLEAIGKNTKPLIFKTLPECRLSQEENSFSTQVEFKGRMIATASLGVGGSFLSSIERDQVWEKLRDAIHAFWLRQCESAALKWEVIVERVEQKKLFSEKDESDEVVRLTSRGVGRHDATVKVTDIVKIVDPEKTEHETYDRKVELRRLLKKQGLAF